MCIHLNFVMVCMLGQVHLIPGNIYVKVKSLKYFNKCFFKLYFGNVLEFYRLVVAKPFLVKFR